MRRLPLALALLLALSACGDGADGYAESVSMDAAMELEEAGAPMADAVVRPVAQVDVPEPASRQLIKTGSVRIRADDHAEGVAEARALTDRLGGFVGDEQSHRYADRVETTLTLRIPAARFDTLLALVSAIDGQVESRTVSVDDVTRQVADVEARLEARRAAEAQFIAILDRAGSIEDVLAVQVQLQRVREEIESAEAQLRALRDQVSLSTLRVTLFEASAAGITEGPGFFARVARAIATGWNGLLETTLALVAIWPFVLGVGILVWWVRRRGWRPRLRRRKTGDRGPETGGDT